MEFRYGLTTLIIFAMAIPTLILSLELIRHYVGVTLRIIKQQPGTWARLRSPECATSVIMLLVFVLLLTITGLNIVIKLMGIAGVNGGHELSVARSILTQLIALILAYMFARGKLG